MEEVAIVRWTGTGTLDRLRTSAAEVLKCQRMQVRVSKNGASLLVEGAHPAAVALALRHLPGASWMAAGFTGASVSELSERAVALARNYLRRGGTFFALAETTNTDVTAMDLSGSVTSTVLGASRGVRVREAGPGVTFRATLDSGYGAVGVQLSEGAGGTPPGNEAVTCLVSGGMHSSVVAWQAALCGYRVRMLHVKVSERSLKEVARLYAELSHRTAPSSLSLEVIEGGSLLGVVAGLKGERVWGGYHSGCGTVTDEMRESVASPLFLLTEEEFHRKLLDLSLKGVEEQAPRGDVSHAGKKRLGFSGKLADINGVLDGLTLRRNGGTV